MGCSKAINQSYQIAAADTFKLLGYFYFHKINLLVFIEIKYKDNTICVNDWLNRNLKYLMKWTDTYYVKCTYMSLWYKYIIMILGVADYIRFIGGM